MWDCQHVRTEPTLVASERIVDREPEVEPWRLLLKTAVTAVLFALLVTWMFSAWLLTPRASDVGALERAIELGEVTGYQRASGLGPTRALWGGMEANTDHNGSMIVWQTTSGRTFYAEPDLAGPVEQPQGPEQSGTRNSATDVLERRLQDAGVLHVSHQGATPLLATLLILLGLFVLINGAAPRRGTRWFWFWVGGVTAGLGVLAWLLLERVWPAPATRPASMRMGGWAGFGVMILASALASIAFSGLF